MKKVGIIAGTLLILLIGGALVVPSFIDWNQYKSEIETTASNLSDRKVTINGDLSLSILPSPAFSAEDVIVSNVEGGVASNFISLKSVDVNVAFFPLLSSDIQVKKFILVEPVIALEVDENGKGNWEFGSGGDESSGGGGTELSFEQFQIENGQISYQDLSAGTQELVRGINADVSMESLDGPFEVAGSVRYKNLPVSADVTVGRIREGRKIPINLTGTLLDDDVDFRFSGGVDLSNDAPMGDGKITLNTSDIGYLMAAAVMLDPEAADQPTPEYNQPLSLETEFAYGGDAVNISALSFEMGESRGSGNLKATLGDLSRFEGALNINSFNLDDFLLASTSDAEEAVTTSESEADFSFLNDYEGTFDFKLGALEYNEKIASQLDVTLSMTNGGFNISDLKMNLPGGSELAVDGTLTAPENKPEFNGDVKLASGNLRAFLEWLKVDVTTIPTGRLTRLNYASAVRADESVIQIYGIDGALDTFQFKGGLSYALQDRPSFGIDAEVSNLNIDNYLPETEEETDYKAALAILADFDANYNLTLNNITTGGVTVKKTTLNGELFDGRLNARTISVEDFVGFDFNGSLIASNLGTEPGFETSFNTTAASLVPLQRAYRFKTEFDIAEVGAVAVNGRLNGTFSNANVDIKSTIGSTKADFDGVINSPAGGGLPDIDSYDLVVSASNPSLVSLIDQFDLPLEKPAANDDRAITVNSALKGTMETIDVDGSMSLAGADITLKGNSQFTAENGLSAFDMAVNIAGDNMREFIRGIGTEFNPANSNLGSINLAMNASGDANNMSFSNIAGNLGPTSLNGNGSLTGLGAEGENAAKPNFDFTLVIDRIPVKEFMEPEPEVPADEDWGNWSDEPMELAVMNDYDGRIGINAASIEYDDYHFQNPRFEAILKDGVLNISNFTGKLFDGDVNVAGTFSSTGDLNMDVGLKGATLNQATSIFAGISPVSGTFDMTQNITGQGLSQNDLISSLNGTGEVVATPGAIRGIDIPRISEQIDGLREQRGILGFLTTALSGGETPYQGGQTTITMKDGFLQLSPFDIQMLGADSAINMGINLAQWKMNLTGDMALSEHPDAPPIGMSIAGDLHNPDISYNTKALEGYIGEKIAASLLQNMVEGNGGLSDLFGGVVGGTLPGGQAPAAEPQTEGQAAPAETEPPAQDFIEPEIEQSEEAPAEEEERPESVEELGTKLLERLFQRPPPPR
ncbi:AsmA family protein [Pseudemcibacter aquimaris]|uniref:AsmA family protein n=1 Tax=Pseudemcibacter aquimaris TaxID=2857064 RepID=UPI00201263AF|nr:AsmA family protein [Pseudemcibacter aquimaris]MCC3861348.1 AsmA family protein [Pseudemcibacter aquimaris]WDU58120.1 AsmA family protein [Pseudemcibacter aquimaris]